MVAMKTNPFLVGNPVPPEGFIGRTELIADIFSKLQTNPAHNIALVGLPRFGKSSIFSYLTNESVRRKYLRDQYSRYNFCEVDLHDLPSDCDSEAFWQYVLDKVGHNSPSVSSAQQRLEHFLAVRRAQHERFILLIDEFEALFAYPNLITLDFLGSLRTQASKSNVLSIVIAVPWGLAECDRRIEQKFHLPTGSPYLNVFLPLWIEPFCPAEVDSLLDKYLGRDRSYFEQADRTWIYEVSGGLPLLVQAAASILYDSRIRSQSFDQQRLTAILQGQVEHHYEKIFRLLKLTTRQTLLYLCQAGTTCQDYANLSEADLQTLRQHGLIANGAQGWRVRSQSLLEWIRIRAQLDLPSVSSTAGFKFAPHSPRASVAVSSKAMSWSDLNRPTLRKLLFAVLRIDSALDAFCFDYFPDTKRLFANSMDRDQKVNLLLEQEDHAAILKMLKVAHPTAVQRHLQTLLAESVQFVAPVQTLPATASASRTAGGSATERVGKWDFFIAHAGADTEPAIQLYDLLKQWGHRPYVDKKCLLPGDDWSVELPMAQQQAQITVVLVSSHCQRAYYQREEIAAAIALARDQKYSHRLIPVYLTGWPSDAAAVPYGLRTKHGLNAEELGGIRGIAQALDVLMAKLQEYEAEDPSRSAALRQPPPMRPAADPER